MAADKYLLLVHLSRIQYCTRLCNVT